MVKNIYKYKGEKKMIYITLNDGTVINIAHIKMICKVEGKTGIDFVNGNDNYEDG